MDTVKTVLVVDDDPGLRSALRAGFEAAGYRVVDAPDGRRALARLQEATPVLVLLDVILPEMSGYELCEQLRRSASLSGVRVVMLSARAFPEDRAHAAEAGADAFFAKPVSLAKLLACARSLLAGRRIEAVA